MPDLSWGVAAGGVVLLLVWFFIYRRKPKTPLEQTNEFLTKRRAGLAKIRWWNQTGNSEKVTEEIDRQDRELDALKRVCEADPSDGE